MSVDEIITTKSYSFNSEDDVPIHGICMIPDKPVAILQMVHGMNEHKERYTGFMEDMAKKGYITLMHDNRGHGESVKDKEDIGYFYSAMDKGMVEDTYMATKYIRKEYPNLPIILYGHSLGSLIVREYLKKHDDEIDGLIVSGCPSYMSITPFGKSLIRVLENLHGDRYRSTFVKNLGMGNYDSPFRNENRKYAWLSTDNSVSDAFMNDPLCEFTYTLNGFMTVLNLETAVYKDTDYQVKNESLPIMFMSGRDDPCMINEKKWNAAMEHMRKLGYKNVNGKLFDGMRHEVHNEPDRQAVYKEIDRFCTVCSC